MGGICLNWGCIPTKALLRSAEVYHNMQHADAYGLIGGQHYVFDEGRGGTLARYLEAAIGRRRTPDEEKQSHHR